MIVSNSVQANAARVVMLPPARNQAAKGINICGYLRDESGWGAAVRGYVRALQARSIPITLLDLSDLSTNRSNDGTFNQFDTEHPFDLNLVCVDASQHFGMLARVGMNFFEARYNIGAWAWELPRFPGSWFNRFAYYDEIWVTTSFVANALAPVAPVPVVRIPPVLTPTGIGIRARGRAQLDVCDDEFVFLFIFDFHSHMQRKNPLAAIDAFRRTFTPSDSVRLVLKCVNADADPDGFALLQARARAHRISIYEGYWSAQAMRDLMAACDAYVSLHRSEGTGLTITDALAQGKPVIATGWSGNMDFMNVANSFPVRYELMPIQQTVGPYHAGEMWAEPAIEHAAEQMRYVVENPIEARGRGQAAQRDIELNYSEEKIAALIQMRLDAIAVRRNLDSFRVRTRRAYLEYQNLIGEIRRVVRDHIPPRATVIVVSKGDEELCKLGACIGWHFPQTRNGTYAGYHPADSNAAIAELEALRARGGEFFLFPNTAFWWLEYYVAFAEYLETHHTRMWADESCIIYRLT